MDTWGIICIVLGLVLYFAFKKNPNHQSWKEFGIFLFGLGIGIVISTIYIYYKISNLFSEL